MPIEHLLRECYYHSLVPIAYYLHSCWGRTWLFLCLLMVAMFLIVIILNVAVVTGSTDGVGKAYAESVSICIWIYTFVSLCLSGRRIVLEIMPAILGWICVARMMSVTWMHSCTLVEWPYEFIRREYLMLRATGTSLLSDPGHDSRKLKGTLVLGFCSVGREI